MVEQLLARGRPAVWWPAFDLLPIADGTAIRETLQRLGQFDLALFVSQPAVDAVRSNMPDRWPANTAIGAVGQATAAAALTLAGVAPAMVIAPALDGGSEDFWRTWMQSGRRARRVLMLRAEHGRDFLIDRFVAQGAQVETLAVYRRAPHPLSDSDQRALRDWIAAQSRPVVLFSSSEAVEAVDCMVGSDDARQWLRTGLAVATHARIEQQLIGARYARVLRVASDDNAIIATLESPRL